MSDRWLGPWPLWMVIFGLIFGAALVLSVPADRSVSSAPATAGAPS